MEIQSGHYQVRLRRILTQTETRNQILQDDIARPGVVSVECSWLFTVAEIRICGHFQWNGTRIVGLPHEDCSSYDKAYVKLSSSSLSLISGYVSRSSNEVQFHDVDNAKIHRHQHASSHPITDALLFPQSLYHDWTGDHDGRGVRGLSRPELNHNCPTSGTSIGPWWSPPSCSLPSTGKQ